MLITVSYQTNLRKNVTFVYNKKIPEKRCNTKAQTKQIKSHVLSLVSAFSFGKASLRPTREPLKQAESSSIRFKMQVFSVCSDYKCVCWYVFLVVVCICVQGCNFCGASFHILSFSILMLCPLDYWSSSLLVSIFQIYEAISGKCELTIQLMFFGQAEMHV